MRLRFFVCAAVLAIAAAAQADTIAKWTFETSAPTGTGQTNGPHAPEVGAGSANGFHASASTGWSNPVGNGSVEAWSSNNWGIGDYYQFQVDLSGYEDVIVSWDQTRSSTGPGSFDLQYSTDGTTFTSFTSYTVGVATWSSVTPDGASSFTGNLSSVMSLDGDSSVFFRLRSTVAGSGAAGTNRVDNFQVDATATAVVPLPAAWLGGGVLLGAMAVVRRAKGR